MSGQEIEIIGWIGAIAFCLCGAPLAFRAYRRGWADESLGFLLLWTLGEIASIIYTMHKDVTPLLWNYAFNLIFLAIVYRYQFFPRKGAKRVHKLKVVK